MSEKLKNFFRQMFTIGTPECAVFFGVAAMVLALLFLLLGFWKSVMIAALVAVGAFLGGVKDKKGCISRVVNRLFPPKTSVPYREKATTEEIEKALHDTKEEPKE